MRFVVLGIGAVGGTIAWALHEVGHDVTGVARGEHFERIAADGLVVERPDATHTCRLPVVPTPTAAEVRADDVVIVATKSHQVTAALDDLARTASPEAVIATATNGVAAEGMALRRFARVAGICTIISATHLEPGTVTSFGWPDLGILDLGTYPGARDVPTEGIAEAFTAAGFRSRAVDHVMRFKYRKLIHNMVNALDALAGRDQDTTELRQRAREEAMAVFAAAGVDVATPEEDGERRAGLTTRPAGSGRGGSSTWQSLARGQGSVETEYLNGEVVLLGRRHGVATPVNEMLQVRMRRMLADGAEPGSVPVGELLEAVGDA